MSRPKVAMYWLAGCGGCEESILDLGMDLLALADRADIVFWPIAMDVRYRELESFPDNSIDVALINGAVRDDAQERTARLLRRKSKIIIAHGICAQAGGVPGLAEFYGRDNLLRRAYQEVPSLESDGLPQTDTQMDHVRLHLPNLRKRLVPLDRVIPVDYYLPGCPPPPELVKEALFRALDGKLPEKGGVLAENAALCMSCPRLESKPDTIRLKRFHRLYEVRWDPERCFLEQGLICLGPATRGGCGAQCLNANMPCRGCFGPLDNVSDVGARVVGMLAALLDETDPDKLESIAAEIPDPAGLFYRYTLAASILKSR